MRRAQSRESSPALDELEKRLGISRTTGDASVVPSGVDHLRQEHNSARAASSSRTPVLMRATSLELETRSSYPATSSPVRPSENAIEEMKQRFLRTPTGSPYSTPTKVSNATDTLERSRYESPQLRTRRSVTNLQASVSSSAATGSIHSYQSPIKDDTRTLVSPAMHAPTPERVQSSLKQSLDFRVGSSASSTGAPTFPHTPDLISDWSDTTTQSSGVTTPPRTTAFNHRGVTSPTTYSSLSRHVPLKQASGVTDTRAPAPKILSSKRSLENLRIPAPLSQESKCARCSIPLFTSNGGKFVTVPEEPSTTGAPPKVYHSDCFVCNVCDLPFSAGDNGRAVFVRTQKGPCHVEVR
jgi:hypothetical protein